MHKEFLMGNHDNSNIMLEMCKQGLIENISWEDIIKVGKIGSFFVYIFRY